MDPVTWVQILDDAICILIRSRWCYLYFDKIFHERYEFNYSPPCYELIVGQIEFFNLGMETNQGGKFRIQTSCTLFKKLKLYHILLMVEGLGKYI